MPIALLTLLFIASWLSPLHFPPWVSWHSEAIAFLALVLALGIGWFKLAVGRGQPDRGVAIPLMAWPFLALGVLALAQSAAGLMLFRGDAVVVLLYMGFCAGAVILGFNWHRRDPAPASVNEALETLAAAFLFSGVVSVGVALAQSFELWMDSQWIVRTALLRPGANLAQPNQLGTLLVMGFASAVFLYESKRFGHAAMLALCAALGMGLAATESRSAALGAAALLAWWLLRRAGIDSRASARAGVGVAGGVVLAMACWPTVYAAVMITGAGAGTRIGEKGVRLDVWAQLLEALMLKPWSGWGILQTPVAQNAVVHNHRVAEPFSYSHNLALDLAIWIGVPLALLLIIPALIWMGRRIKRAVRLQPWYCVAIALPLLVHAMLEFPYAYAYFLLPVLFAAGSLEGLLRVAPVLSIGRWTSAALLVVFGGTALWSVVEYSAIEEDFRVMRFEVLRLGSRPPDHVIPQVRLFTQLGAVLDSGRVELKSGMPPEQLELLRRTALRYAWSAPQYRYAIALALNGNEQEAIRQFQVIRLMDGERMYARLKIGVRELGETKHPQLLQLKLP